MENSHNAIQYEVREDPEQQRKCDETLELLLMAGYFRARSKDLTAFDKVVGGMAWCLLQCHLDGTEEVDVLYSETSTIGQKISVTEKIVRLVPFISSSLSIEPHQIQGLDFIHIFPVVQALVKAAIEAREARGESALQEGIFKLDPAQPTQAQSQSKSCILVQNSTIQRVYKQISADDDIEIAELIQRALLEYGSSVTNSSSGKEFKSYASSLTEQHRELSTHAIERLIQSGDSKVTTVKIDRNDGQGTEETSEEKRKRLQSEIEDLKSRLEQTEQEHETLRQQKIKVDKKKEEISAEKQELSELEANLDQNLIEEIKTLLVEHDCQTKLEHDFKTQCQVDMAKIEAEIEELTQSLSQTELDKHQEVQVAVQACEQRLAKLRLQQATVTRQCAELQRKIDQNPSAAEIAQYQKRFLEVYNQMNWLHAEARQYYGQHNCLIDVQNYFNREIETLDKVSRAIEEQGLGSLESKLNLEITINDLIDKVIVSKNTTDKRRHEVYQEEKMISDLVQELINKNRLYQKTLADLAQEMSLNEQLGQQAQELKIHLLE